MPTFASAGAQAELSFYALPPTSGTPHCLLETVRRDLETKTVEEFVREWRVLD